MAIGTLRVESSKFSAKNEDSLKPDLYYKMNKWCVCVRAACVRVRACVCVCVCVSVRVMCVCVCVVCEEFNIYDDSTMIFSRD